MDATRRLRDLSTPLFLETSTHDLVGGFYEPVLAVATRYDRGVGYFTSGWVELATRGLELFAAHGGRARFLVSPHLSAGDWEALLRGSTARVDAAVKAALLKEIDELHRLARDDVLSTLAWHVAEGVLDFRVVIPQGRLSGDFHDKFGIFADDFGDRMAFHGSQNDSAKAFANYEAISIYYSWLGFIEAERVDAHALRFERLWNGEDPNARVLTLPDAARQKLISLAKRRPRTKVEASPPTDRWRHQAEARHAFLQSGFGVLEMATGTGKTRTAIAILNELTKAGQIDSAVVATSGTDLLDQWHAELVRHTDWVVCRAYGGHRDALAYQNDPYRAILLTSRQNLAETLRRLPKEVSERSFLICDEVHGLGSPALVSELSGLLSPFRFRLGLSATPEREYDEAGNDFVAAEIGPVVFRFGLEEAIRRGILCEFDYVALEYGFSDEDRAAVRRAISSYHAKAKQGSAPPIETMYRDIARVAKLSREKLPVFAAFLKAQADLLRRGIIFVETAEYGYLVQQLLLPYVSRYHTYYAEDDRANLVRFAAGELDTIITCHRISEGIDIRSVNSIVLFSSARSKLETIQRLGRCLRVDPQQPDKRALVVDFVRVDDLADAKEGATTADQARRDWFERLAQIKHDDPGAKT